MGKISRGEVVANADRQLRSLDDGLEGFQKLFEAISANLRLQLAEFAQAAESEVAPGESPRLKAELDEARRHIARLEPLAAQAAEVEALQGRVEAARQRAEEADRLEAELARVRSRQDELQRQVDEARRQGPELSRLRAAEVHLTQEVKELTQAKAQGPSADDLARVRADNDRLARDLSLAREQASTVDALKAEVEQLRQAKDDSGAGALKEAFESARSDGITAWDRVYELEKQVLALTSAAAKGGAGEKADAGSASGEWVDRSTMHRRMVENEDEIATLRAALEAARASAGRGAQTTELREKLAQADLRITELTTERDLAVRRLQKYLEPPKASVAPTRVGPTPVPLPPRPPAPPPPAAPRIAPVAPVAGGHAAPGAPVPAIAPAAPRPAAAAPPAAKPSPTEPDDSF